MRLLTTPPTLPLVRVTDLAVTGHDADGADVTVEDDLFLQRFELEEWLSEPYVLMLTVATTDHSLFVPGLVGGRCGFHFARGTFERSVHGVVFKADTIGVIRGRLHMRLWVGPSMQVLGLSRRRRIFQAVTAVDIVEQLLQPVLDRYGGTLDKSLLEQVRLRVRDYCVQFDETDLAFAQRLLAEEGITFAFRHDGDAEEIALMPMTAILHSVDGEEEATPKPVPLRSHQLDTAPEEVVRSLEGSTKMRCHQAESSVYDWKVKPPVTVFGRQDPFSQDEVLPTSLARFGEHYEHEPFRPVEEEEGGPLFEDVDGEANLIANRNRPDDVRANGAGNVIGFKPGATFELTDHPTPDLDGLYALLSVTHCAEFDHDADLRSTNSTSAYENRFTCFRFGGPNDAAPYTYAPPRRPKPQAPGPVTATVVGPKDEEIYTDEHGRIRVRLHWDREGLARGDHETSCWVPVAQAWAGPGYGTVFIPRVGMEVVIDFLAGDPDRPLCSGVVYNGLNRPPYTLPDERTRTVIKTSSSPGGGGFNELSFEDGAGREEVFLHAQRNLREVVKASHTTTVGGNQSDSVGGDHSVSISGNQTNTVEKDQTETVTGNVTLEVTGTRDSTITGKETVTLLDARDTWITKTETHQVTEMLTELFDGGRTTIVDKCDGETVKTGDKSVEVVEGYYTVSAATKISLTQDETHKLVLENNALLSTSTDFTVTNGKVSVSSEGGALKLSAADELSLTCGSASIVLKKDGSIDIQGSAKVAMGTPGTSFTAEPSGAAINSAKIVSQAIGVHEIKGALVKIN